MFAKLVVTLVTMAVVGASVLSMRHARLEAVHDLANTQRRVLQADRELWRLRADVASFAQPARVREMAHGLGPLVHVIDAPRVTMTLASGTPELGGGPGERASNDHASSGGAEVPVDSADEVLEQVYRARARAAVDAGGLGLASPDGGGSR